jgi:hypothetical protein
LLDAIPKPPRILGLPSLLVLHCIAARPHRVNRCLPAQLPHCPWPQPFDATTSIWRRWMRFGASTVQHRPSRYHTCLIQSGAPVNLVTRLRTRVRETFELNRLKSTPSQLLPVSSGFDRLQTCCHEFGLANILFYFFKCRLISSSF